MTKAKPTSLEQLVARVEALGYRLTIGPDGDLRIIDAKTWALVMRAADIAEVDRWVAGGGRTGEVVPFPTTFEPLGLPSRQVAGMGADVASDKWRQPSKRTAQIRVELADVLAKLRAAADETEPSSEEE